MEVIVSLSDTAVGFDLMHPPFKQAIQVDNLKVCCLIPFVSVFTHILCPHTGNGGTSLVSGPQTFPLRRGEGLSDRLRSCCTGRNADYKCCFHNTHFADAPFPAITERMRV